MSMTLTFKLGELLSKVRRDAGLEQVEIAQALGIARNTVSNYETGRSAPSFDVVVKWARLTGVELDTLAQVVSYTPRDLNPEPSD